MKARSMKARSYSGRAMAMARRLCVLSILLLVCAALSNAALSREAQAQSLVPDSQAGPLFSLNIDSEALPALQRTISIDLGEASLARLLREIAQQGGFGLSYSPDLIPAGELISVQIGRSSVADALRAIAEHTDLKVLISPQKEIVLVRESSPEAAASVPIAGLTTYAKLTPEQLPVQGLVPVQVRRQTGTITGVVTDAETGGPLPGMNVIVADLLPEQQLGAATDAEGRYTIEAVPVGEHTVEARFIGYQTATRQVTVPDGDTVVVDFELTGGVLELEQAVVTGAGVVTEKQRLGQAISTVDAEEIATAPVSTVSEALQGRVPGLVANPEGEVGAAAPIRIRGTVSLTQRNGPLIYIDGVRVSSGREVFASVTTSTLSQINPANIARIEVLKGAAAATLYGTEASAGVIQIFTKKGIDAPMQWNFEMTQGISQTPLGRIPPNVVYDPETGELLSNSPAQHFIDLGHQQEYNLSARGGTGTFGYYMAGWYRTADSSLPTNGRENVGARVNLTARPMDGLQVRFGLNVIDDRVRIPYPDHGLMGEFVLADPRQVNENRPFGELFHTIPGVLAYENIKTTDRSTMSAEVNYQWTDELRSHILVGYHERSYRAQISVPPGPDVRNPTGLRHITNGTRSETTLELSATWDAQPWDYLTSTLIVGAQSFWEEERSNVSGVEDFPGPAVPTLRGGSTVTEVDELYREVISAGVFVQEQLGLNDRLFLTAGLRVDGNSTFGENFGFQPYPRVGLSWVVSDEPFWDFEVLDVLRLRAAYGTSGLQPGVYDALRTWQVQSLLANLPVVLPESFGNPDLKPERSREIEVGGNVALLDGRLGLNVTYYWQRTADAILARERPPSAGFLAPQLVNIGELQSRGLEASAEWTAVDNSALRWELFGTFATRTQTVTDLGGITGFKTSSDTRRWNFIMEGYQPGAVIAPVMDPEDPYHLTVPVSELTELSQIVPNFLLTESGERARVFIGNQLPTIMGSFGTTLSFPKYNLHLSALLRAEGGFVVTNETDLIRTGSNITPATARMIQDLSDPSTSTERRREIAENYAKIHPLVHSNWVEDGDYLRLQKLAVTWDVPPGVAGWLSIENASVTLAGRNLALFTGYDGLIDPGSSSVANPLAANVDYFGSPTARQVELMISLSF